MSDMSSSTSENRRLKVFLCHASGDKIAVQALYERLSRDKVEPWLDKEDLIAGQDWETEIRKAVRESDAVLVCLSSGFNQAGFRQKEVRFALDVADEQLEGTIFVRFGVDTHINFLSSFVCSIAYLISYLQF